MVVLAKIKSSWPLNSLNQAFALQWINVQWLWPVARAAMFVVLVARAAMTTISTMHVQVSLLVSCFSNVVFALFMHYLLKTWGLIRNSKNASDQVKPFSSTLLKIADFWDHLWPATDVKVWSLFACILPIFGIFCLVVPGNVSKFKTYNRWIEMEKKTEIEILYKPCNLYLIELNLVAV